MKQQDIDRICDLGRAVIDSELEAVRALKTRIDENFAQACRYLLDCKGKIIVMGIGKSGHIARKLAATFASTGSPAFFIHPAEARHGDFGMIAPGDVILIISNSGETSELLDIIPFIKRLGLPLISLTGKIESTIARIATVNINISVEKEACPLGLAPTSSTTAALVMGDALAVSLLDRRGFTPEDFALSHPGGALGRRLLLRVEEIMHKEEAIPRVSMDVPLKTALMEMTQKKLGMTTIINSDQQLVGVFTDGDVRRAFDGEADVHNTIIRDIMTPNPKVIPPHTLAVDAQRIMENHKITSLIVTDHTHKPVGVVHMHDILQAGIS
ncbi:MAG: KpsF/GutQ family sugar-phosphate isomerase [Gammaproteobacteria bacterium]|nr:KpsF/GutQ family sugar-phosphate isomerase [Gammaproteobacteria bacterium]